MNLLVVLLIALPMCLAQFTIQGPSDGNRVAQGYTVDQEKGIRYTDQSDNSGNSGFSIQGATVGKSNIQSASDGHSDYQIQGPTPAQANTYFQPETSQFSIQGATAGGSQYIDPNAYHNDQASPKSLQYNDPSGLRVNWRSYDRQQQQGAEPAIPQYSEAAVSANVPRATQQRHRARPQPQPQPQPQPRLQPRPLPRPQPRPQPQAEQQYVPGPASPINNAPNHIKQLLQYQAHIPYENGIPEAFRFNSATAAELAKQNPQSIFHPVEQDYSPPDARRPIYRGKPSALPRERRQAPQYKQQAAPQPAADPAIKYSANIPSNLQQVLKLQAQIPYVNGIPEPYRFDFEPVIQMQKQQVEAHFRDLTRQAQSSAPVKGHPRQRRQAPQGYHPQAQPRPQPQPQQLPQEPQPHYSTNVPEHLQQLLKYQSQIPYNIIANQIKARLDKPYVPELIQPGKQQVHYQGQQSPIYQAPSAPQNPVYPSQEPQYPQYPQQQPGYQPQQQHGYPQQQLGYQQSPQEVRPVTEKQY